MPLITADDGSFSFEYEPGITCTSWRYAPIIYIMNVDSDYFREGEDGIMGYMNIIMAEHLNYLKSIQCDLNDDLIYVPTYIFDYVPGKWCPDTLTLMLEQAVRDENYEKAQSIKNELDALSKK